MRDNTPKQVDLSGHSIPKIPIETILYGKLSEEVFELTYLKLVLSNKFSPDIFHLFKYLGLRYGKSVIQEYATNLFPNLNLG